MKSKIEAVATFLMIDVSELKDYRYHYGRTTQAVWALCDAYYCSTKEKQTPAKHRDGMSWNWVEVKNDLVNSKGFKIWESKHTE